MEHPIGGIMRVTMENIRDMVDVNTVIGDPVATGDGSTIIPVSKVSFGYLAGGGEYAACAQKGLLVKADMDGDLPFAGGSGAGVSVQPVGFLVCQDKQVKMLCAQPNTSVDHMIELLPQLLLEARNYLGDKEKRKEEKKQQKRYEETGDSKAVNYPRKDVPEM